MCLHESINESIKLMIGDAVENQVEMYDDEYAMEEGGGGVGGESSVDNIPVKRGLLNEDEEEEEDEDEEDDDGETEEGETKEVGIVESEMDHNVNDNHEEDDINHDEEVVFETENYENENVIMIIKPLVIIRIKKKIH